MTDPFHAYACFDLSALRSDVQGDEGEQAHGSDSRDTRLAGKMLLVVSAKGIELLNVPAVLH